MTPDEIIHWVQKVKNASSDPEIASGLEYGLWRNVLTAISGMDEDSFYSPSDLAFEALKTLEINFPRWKA